MKRRRFVQNLLVVPAAAPVGALAAQETKPQQQPQPQPNTPARQMPRQPPTVPKLTVVELDTAAETSRHFFTDTQFATLEKLGAVMVPPIKNNPGALDAKAPTFLDFLISVSPADRQKLYQHGLDVLNETAQKKYSKPFSEMDSAQVDAILKPLLTVRPWPHDLPSDPMKNFIAQVHEDLRTATINSREWAAATANSGHRFTRGSRSSGMYWAPIDPISEG
jgi:hypothetical protein